MHSGQLSQAGMNARSLRMEIMGWTLPYCTLNLQLKKNWPTSVVLNLWVTY